VNKLEWAGFEIYIFNVSRRFGEVGDAILSRKEILFVIPESAGRSGSSEQAIWLEEVKSIKRREEKYRHDNRNFVGFLMESLSPAIDRAMRVQNNFDKLYADHNSVELWIMLKSLCINNTVKRLDDIKHHLWGIRQGNRTYDEFILDFELQVRYLSDCGEKVSESDQVIIFLNGLDSDRYTTKLADVRSLSDEAYPKTYLDIKAIFDIWINSRFPRGDTGAVSNTNSNNESIFAVSRVRTCYRCGGHHYMSQCKKNEDSVVCRTCSGYGHLTKHCAEVKAMRGGSFKDVNEKVACISVGSEDEWVIG
jgi:hypothetical protein